MNTAASQASASSGTPEATPVTTPVTVPESATAHPAEPQVARQAARYLQASIIGTLANFVSRFPLTELMGFESSVIVANYIGMGLVFLLSYRRAFGVDKPTPGMGARFVLVAHVGLATVWLVSTLCLSVTSGWLPGFLREMLPAGLSSSVPDLDAWLPRLVEGGCHGAGIVAGFFVNFFGHREFSFRQSAGVANGGQLPAWIFAVLVPVAYLVLYAPMSIDTTDFGFFYGHPWRILMGEMPFRDFYYTKPPASLYWHAFWMWLTPEAWRVLAGKAGFFVAMLVSSWLGSLFLNRAFDLGRLGIPLPLLATAGFVFSAHSFPAMPWHTADGMLFGAACLWLAVVREGRLGWLAGLVGAVTVLTKQSFVFVPLAAGVVMLALFPWRRAAVFALACAAGLLAFVLALVVTGAFGEFVRMTTGGLSTAEALKAGIGIYLHQDWLLPGLTLGAVLLAPVAACVLRRITWANESRRDAVLSLLKAPFAVPLYFVLLAVWYGITVFTTRQWIGYGASWPTLLVLTGGVCVLLPWVFLKDVGREASSDGSAGIVPLKERLARRFTPSLFLGAALTLAWSSGISGGYKIPAFFAAPLLLGAAVIHRRVGGRAATALWVALFCGLAMFRMGHEHPYVFPERPMPRASLVHHAGDVFPSLQGVMVDAKMQGILRDLKNLRATYGPNIKTLPGFPLVSMLTGDKPVFPAEWLQDWEIAGDTEKLYQLLVDRDITVLFEKDQLDTVSPDGYARTRYTVPQRVRNEWRKVDETEHFVVFQKP